MWTRLRLAFVAIAVLASVPLGPVAMTAETRVALLEPPANLLEALGVALSPWGLRVVSVSTRIPVGDVAAATDSARALSSAQGVAAVVWIQAPPGQRASLWLYDAQTGQITVRPLSLAPPLDDASAAALALTVKTLLRSTTVAPPKERTEPLPSGSAAPAAAASATPPAVLPTPSGSAPVTPPPAAPASSTAATAAPQTHAFRLEALALARWPTGTSALLAPRAALGFAYWPPFWDERLGFGLDVEAGTSLDLTTHAFAGTFGDAGAALSVRARLGHDVWSLEGALGPSLHVTTLSGTVVALGHTDSSMRVDPAVDAQVIPQLGVGPRLRLGVALGTRFWLRTQRYTLGGDTILRLPPVVVDMGVRASLALD